MFVAKYPPALPEDIYSRWRGIRPYRLIARDRPSALIQWVDIDPRVDYRRAFGGGISPIKALAVMRDGDDPGESARA